MNRFLLDTNILVYLLGNDSSEISKEVVALIGDYENQLYTSSVCILEILQLYRIGKIKLKRGQKITDIQNSISEDLGIEILPFTTYHTQTLSKLTIADGHNDPFDHAIISHAITDKYTLVSSDRKFKSYEYQNLNFVFNKR